MSIAVTGATGHLGRLIVESLLRRGVPPDQIVALGRNVAKADDLRDRGLPSCRSSTTTSTRCAWRSPGSTS
ncbi:SDR family oxidoreductase [Phytohabitans flavus]|uniref:SDR family oxidoreductase n=1 Tax=Phytohabitans flavus TaxID=1076124 RepID=UPI001E61AEE9|nr:SDR family oxidoreductase [Phytohabitans flavus]